MRVVLDTNVWLSALLWGGEPDKILQQVEARTLQAIASEEILSELIETLERPKLQKRLVQVGLRAHELVMAVQSVVTIVATEPLQVQGLRDPKDAIIIAAAIAGNAAIIITGDKDLLCLAAIDGIQILTPRAFLDRDK